MTAMTNADRAERVSTLLAMYVQGQEQERHLTLLGNVNGNEYAMLVVDVITDLGHLYHRDSGADPYALLDWVSENWRTEIE
jgi:hypothetical protein